MNLVLPLSAEEEAKLKAQANARGTTPADLVRQALEPLLSTDAGSSPPTKKHTRHISQIIMERMKALPPEVFERLPKDGASEHDHYLYGSPKRHA